MRIIVGKFIEKVKQQTYNTLMSGHSKWSTIKRQKGVADAKRGQLFTKHSKAITIAVRNSGGITNSESNFKLRLAIDKARASNMPKENIQRAIDRGKGGGGQNVVELLYEGFGPGGVALMIEALTDNKQRTVAEIKNLLEKNGGILANTGSVSHLFVRRGEFIVKKEGLEQEDILSKAIDAGIEDIEEEGDLMFLYTNPKDLQKVRLNLEGSGVNIDSAQIMYAPISYVTLDTAEQGRALNLIEKVNALDDVQEVYSNLG